MEHIINDKINELTNLLANKSASHHQQWTNECTKASSQSPLFKRSIHKSILNEVEGVISAVASGEVYDTLLKGSYYRSFLNLASSTAINNDQEINDMKEVSELFKFSLRHIVERMDKEKLFEGFSEENANIYNNQCNGSSDIFSSYFFDDALDLLVEYSRKPWSRDKIAIGLFGKTCAGKTKVLNTIFDEHFPVCNGENTAIPTYLYFGEDCDVISLVDAQDNIQQISTNDISVIDWDKSFHFPFHRIYDYIAKQNNSDILRGFTFVDAPGVFSGSSSNHIAADKCIDKTDIIVWVTDLRDSITTKEIEYLKKHSNGKPVYVIPTWTNQMSDDEYKRAKDVLISKFEEANIDIKGVIRYNTNDIDSFRDTFINIVITGTLADDEIKPSMPVQRLKYGIEYLVMVLEANLSHYAEMKTQTENKVDEISTTLRSQQTAFQNRFQSVISSIGNVVTQCQNSIFTTALTAPIQQLTQDVNRMIDAYNNMNVVGLSVDVTKYNVLRCEAEDKLTIIQELQQRLNDIIEKIS